MNIVAKIENMYPLERINLQDGRYIMYREQMTALVKSKIDNGECYGFSNDMNTIKYFGIFKENELIIKN